MVDETDLKRASPMVVLALLLVEGLGAPSKSERLGLVFGECMTEYKGGASAGQLAGCTIVKLLSFGDV